MNLGHRHSALFVSSVVTVVAFVATSVYSQHRLARLDTVSSTIEDNAAPSIGYLARANARLNRTEELLEDIASGEDGAGIRTESRENLAAFREDVDRYLSLPPVSGERKYWTELRTDVDDAVSKARTTLNAADRGDLQQASLLLRTSADPAFDRSQRIILDTLEFDARESELFAHQVRDVRRSARVTVFVLDAAASAIAVFAALFAYRASRQHDELVQAHTTLLSDRVAELDRFAGRVAHDILGPVGAIGFSLQRLAHTGGADQAPQIARAGRALHRVQELVEALLAFARSGARPQPDATCEVSAILSSLAADCEDLATASTVALVIEPYEPLRLACSAGVATSILENLVRNAIKYVGDSPVKRVTVRVKREGNMARIDVEDTGPGIPTPLQRDIFEPFVRASDDGVGMGLGLATVKRLVERHGGGIRLRSQLGAGSTFSVDLPCPPAA
jgi:signal transduction histidine kinase